MECFEKPAFRELTPEKIKTLKRKEIEEEFRTKVRENWDGIAKPIDGMGQFEVLTAQIGAILGTDEIDLTRKAVVVLCADNGIVEEGISQSGWEVTAAAAKSIAEGRSAVGKMAEAIGARVLTVDMGMKKKEPIEGVLDRKIRCGTRNFRRQPAMTEQETLRSIMVGIQIAKECKREGCSILATGEMGIGNTTTSSAVTAALLKCSASQVAGRGAGLDDQGLARKKQVIDEALEKYRLYEADPLTILSTVGGFDIAGLTGICIGGAVCGLPVVLDGVISLTGALLAERLVPGVKGYLIPSHKGKEPAAALLLKELGLEAVIDGKMALGEGTGAVMMLGLLELSLSVYRERTSFSDIEIEKYKRF